LTEDKARVLYVGMDGEKAVGSEETRKLARGGRQRPARLARAVLADWAARGRGVRGPGDLVEAERLG